MTNKNKFLTVQEAAVRLKVSEHYIHQLVSKKRLHWVGQNQLAVGEVEQLSDLMNKLRKDGIAALVDIAAKDKLDM